MLQLSPIEKSHHQLASSVGTTVPLHVKADHAVTDGINPEHKQERTRNMMVPLYFFFLLFGARWQSSFDWMSHHLNGSNLPRLVELQ